MPDTPPKTDATQVCRELYPALFERFEDALGSSAILEMLDKTDLDEARSVRRLEAKLKVHELTLSIPGSRGHDDENAGRRQGSSNSSSSSSSKKKTARDRFRDRPWLGRGPPNQPMSPLKFSAAAIKSAKSFTARESSSPKRKVGKGWVSGRRRTVG